MDWLCMSKVIGFSLYVILVIEIKVTGVGSIGA